MSTAAPHQRAAELMQELDALLRLRSRHMDAIYVAVGRGG
jgi:hypothetical protein